MIQIIIRMGKVFIVRNDHRPLDKPLKISFERDLDFNNQ